MRFVLPAYLLIVPFLSFCQQTSSPYLETAAVFTNIPNKLEEASPSITADGKCLIFTRYRDWQYKTVYLAAKLEQRWLIKRIGVEDSIYNIAIRPDGRQLIYAKTDASSPDESDVYTVFKDSIDWTDPIKIKALHNTNAGYFHFTDGGDLFYYATQPKVGTYKTRLTGNTISEPEWLGDQINLPDSDSFDLLMHPDQDRLLITQYYDAEKYPARGAPGIYYYEKIDGNWQRIKRLPIPYGWGATVTPDGLFIFVQDSELRQIELKKLGIKW